MLKPLRQKIFKSIDELLDSNSYKIEYFEDFNFIQEDNPKFIKAYQGRRVVRSEILSDDDNEWTVEYIERNFASFHSCKHFKNLIEHQGDGKSWRGLYQIQEVALTERQNLFTAPFHPLLDKFQKLMDLSFEAGLPSVWEKFHFEFFNSYNKSENFQRIVDDDQMLDFAEIAPFFFLLLFGFVIAFFALLCEVFFHDFVVRLTEYFTKMKIKDSRQKYQKTKVKRIQVKRNKKKQNFIHSKNPKNHHKKNYCKKFLVKIVNNSLDKLFKR